MATRPLELSPRLNSFCSPTEPPAGQLRFASPATTNFTAGLLAATAKMFPSALVSTGGDELNTPCYDADPETQAILKSTGQTLEQTLDTFTKATHGALESLGKTPVVWEGECTQYTLWDASLTAAWDRDAPRSQCHAIE